MTDDTDWAGQLRQKYELATPAAPTNPDWERIARTMDAVIAWQHHGMRHPLTCATDSQHAVLVPRIGDSPTGVVLQCVECGYQQPLDGHLAAIVGP